MAAIYTVLMKNRIRLSCLHGYPPEQPPSQDRGEGFQHPASSNIEWREARSLLESVGTVVEEHNGHLKVTIGPETEVFHQHGEKNVDKQSVADLRRMLEQAGVAQDGSAAVSDERTRNYGDNRWGKPTQD